MRKYLFPALTVALIALAAPAGSAAVTIGSNLQSVPGPGSGIDNCSNTHQCTEIQLTLLAGRTAPGGLVAPFSGIVTHFRVKTKPVTSMVTLRVLHPLGGTQYTGAGTSAPFMPPAGDPTAGTISPSFAVRMPITAGDSIGLDCCFQGLNGIYNFNAGAGSNLIWGTTTHPALADGASAFNDSAHTDHELLLQADVEADGDKDGFGDDSQDHCVGTAGPVDGCPATAATPASAKCKKRKKARKRASATKKRKGCKKRKKHA